MSMNLEVQKFSTTPEHFIAGITVGIAVAVKKAAAELKAHALVSLNEKGELAAVTAENKASIYGVIPNSAKAGEDAVVYLTGEFFTDSLALESGVSIGDVEVALRNIGIFLK